MKTKQQFVLFFQNSFDDSASHVLTQSSCADECKESWKENDKIHCLRFIRSFGRCQRLFLLLSLLSFSTVFSFETRVNFGLK